MCRRLYPHFTERRSVPDHTDHCRSDGLRSSGSDRVKNSLVFSHIRSTYAVPTLEIRSVRLRYVVDRIQVRYEAALTAALSTLSFRSLPIENAQLTLYPRSMALNIRSLQFNARLLPLR